MPSRAAIPSSIRWHPWPTCPEAPVATNPRSALGAPYRVDGWQRPTCGTRTSQTSGDWRRTCSISFRTRVPCWQSAKQLWAARFTFDPRAVLLVTYDWAKASGEIDPHDLVADDYAACHHFADQVRTTHAAIVVPSAALPGTQNLVVFGSRAASPYQLPAIDPDLDVPTSVVAEHGRPPDDLAGYVCFRGQPHPEFEAWRAGFPYLAPPAIGVPPARPIA